LIKNNEFDEGSCHAKKKTDWPVVRYSPSFSLVRGVYGNNIGEALLSRLEDCFIGQHLFMAATIHRQYYCKESDMTI